MNTSIVVASAVIGLSILLTVVYKKSVLDKKIDELNNLEDEIVKSRLKAKEIVEEAEKEAEIKAKEALAREKEMELKAKEKVYHMKEEAEKEIKSAKSDVYQKEMRLTKKEETLDKKIDRIEVKSQELIEFEEKLKERSTEIEDLKVKQEVELERISGFSKDEAKTLLITKLTNELTHETAMKIKEYENKLKEEKDRVSKRILSTAIGKASADFVVDATVSVVNLPNDEMKGRIIGREGRNIRAIEALTGVDVIIDDTPEAVVISSFDGVKREVARNTIEKLITDGRIHPAKIEEAVNKAKKEINKEIVEAGEHALLELGIPGMHQEIVKTLGRLKFRTSYGQNVLTHSIEVARLAGNLAAEIGANTELAKRAGLLHDVGKVLEHDIEASHAIIGGEFLKKFGEKPEVINAVMAHHNEVEFETIEAVLIQAADAISASRPGARRETLSTYLKRLENLEEIANSFDGVESSFAIQAGREVRIIINPESIGDDRAIKMSRDVAKKIEETMQYPGQIKVTVIRETRAVEYAK